MRVAAGRLQLGTHPGNLAGGGAQPIGIEALDDLQATVQQGLQNGRQHLFLAVLGQQG